LIIFHNEQVIEMSVPLPTILGKRARGAKATRVQEKRDELYKEQDLTVNQTVQEEHANFEREDAKLELDEKIKKQAKLQLENENILPEEHVPDLKAIVSQEIAGLKKDLEQIREIRSENLKVRQIAEELKRVRDAHRENMRRFDLNHIHPEIRATAPKRLPDLPQAETQPDEIDYLRAVALRDAQMAKPSPTEYPLPPKWEEKPRPVTRRTQANGMWPELPIEGKFEWR
jgi:hypothetical protein